MIHPEAAALKGWLKSGVSNLFLIRVTPGGERLDAKQGGGGGYKPDAKRGSGERLHVGGGGVVSSRMHSGGSGEQWQRGMCPALLLPCPGPDPVRQW